MLINRSHPAMAVNHQVSVTSGKAHNDKMERMNGEIRDRERVMRTLEKPDSPILTGMRVYHNFVKPHGLKRQNSCGSGWNTRRWQRQMANHYSERQAFKSSLNGLAQYV